MKARFLNFVRTYWRLALADMLVVFGSLLLQWIFTDRNAPHGTDARLFVVMTLYLLVGVPALMVLHGILSRRIWKKIWAPHVILFVILWFGLPALYHGEYFLEQLFSLNNCLWSGACTAISLISSLITGGIIRIRNAR